MKTINRPGLREQAAALMRLAFQENPGVKMTLQDLEGLVPLDRFSPSTRGRALYHLWSEGAIRMKDGFPNVWWMEVRADD